VGKRLATWVGSPVGQAFQWALIIEGIALLAEMVQRGYEARLEHPKEFPLPPPVLVEILSIEWQLIFLGFGTLIGSFLATARTRRAPDVLLVPFVVVIVAILLVQLLYLIEPWIGSLWLGVALKDAIGLVVIYCCMKNATRVRKK
jgi:hypothetical protein